MSSTTQTQTHSAVLFIIFNRPESTARVFSQIRNARPPRLYIAADGPRTFKTAEDLLCQQARAAAGPIDWPCEVRTIFQKNNLGCREAVVSALDWFFYHEEEGIILEDDCLPGPDFFRFCDTLLERYRHDTRVRHIAGSNLQHGKKHGNASYYFSRISHVWGWASWRRVWKAYNKELASFSLDEIELALQSLFDEPLLVQRWKEVASDLKQKKIDTWDYQLTLTGFLHNGLAATPNVNLISNLGFGENATHTHDPLDPNACQPVQILDNPITHPATFVPIKCADFYTLSRDFEIEKLKQEQQLREAKYNRSKYRFKRWLARHGGPKRWHDAGR